MQTKVKSVPIDLQQNTLFYEHLRKELSALTSSITVSILSDGIVALSCFTTKSVKYKVKTTRGNVLCFDADSINCTDPDPLTMTPIEEYLHKESHRNWFHVFFLNVPDKLTVTCIVSGTNGSVSESKVIVFRCKHSHPFHKATDVGDFSGFP